MPLNPNATATVYIYGLALCRYHQNLWEALFLHVPDHEFDLKVIERSRTTPPGPSDPVLLTRTKIPGRTRLEVAATRVVEPTAHQHRPGNWIDRKGTKWLVDMDELHQPGIQLKQNPPVPLSYLSIQGAKLHTERVTPDYYSLKKASAANPIYTRQVGNVIGADIECEDDGIVSLKIDGNTIGEYEQKPGKRYDIFFDNACPRITGLEDFRHFYEIIDLPQGDEPFEMTKIPGKRPVPKSILSDEGACNPPTGGGNSAFGFEDAMTASVQLTANDRDSQTGV